MGNCCPGSEESEHLTGSSHQNNTQAFQGQGQKLGTADDAQYQPKPAPSAITRDDIPEPTYDKNLSEEERKKIRAERAAAAEARLKKQGGMPKKKKTNSDEPLRGPNSQPLMRWNA